MLRSTIPRFSSLSSLRPAARSFSLSSSHLDKSMKDKIVDAATSVKDTGVAAGKDVGGTVATGIKAAASVFDIDNSDTHLNLEESDVPPELKGSRDPIAGRKLDEKDRAAGKDLGKPYEAGSNDS